MLNSPSPPSISPDCDSMSGHTYINVRNPRDTVPNLDAYNSSDIGSMSPSPPPVTIKQQYSGNPKQSDGGYINLQHVDMDRYDYAVVDKKTECSDSPPVPQQSLNDFSGDDPVYVNVQKGNSVGSQVNNTLDGRNLTKGSSVDIQALGRPAPVPKKRALKSSQSVPPSLSPTKTAGNHPPLLNSNDKLDYTVLDFDDSTDSPQQSTSNPKPRGSAIAKTKFDYSEVMLEEPNVKDVDKALQLKANRLPPTPPAKYNPKQSEPSSSPPPPPPNRQESQPKFFPQDSIAQYSELSSSSPTGGLEDEPPPPPPRRGGASSRPKEM